ncbi:MAG: S9 family peptidase [Psychrobacillus psychrodurans]
MKKKEKTYLSIEELISLPSLSSINVSNNGKKVAYVKRTANWKENNYKEHVWIYNEDSRQSYPVPSSDIDSTSPLWAPDSKVLAYLSSVEENDHKKNQIFVTSVDNFNEAQITYEEEGVSKFKWDPSGNGFYFLTQSEESKEIRKRKERYGDYHYVGKESLNNRLYYMEFEKVIQNKEAKFKSDHADQLTDGVDFHIHDFDISNDGHKVAFIATPTSKLSDYFNADLYILNRTSRELQKLNVDKLLGGSVCFSPDGSKLCYSASIQEKKYYKNQIQENTIEIYDISTGRLLHPLKDFDSTVTPLRWTAKGILIRWQAKTNYHVGFLSDNGTVEMINEKVDSFILEASVTDQGNSVSYIKALKNETFEIYLNDNKLTNENSYIKENYTCNREIISWQSSDGMTIEGVLSTPVEFDATKSYPLLVIVHGGPAWASFPIFSSYFNEKYPIEQFIEKGFIVLEPNYRGSSGYGNDFLRANYRKQGIADYEDIISGVNQLVEDGIAEQDRVGIMGWSNGGYISAFCSTFSNRFKAISVGGGITDWSSHYVITDIPYLIRMYLGNDPWNDPEIYTKTSPMTYIKTACTPTLIQHGDNDARVPVYNAYALYRGLMDMDVDTELVIFKGMGYSPDQPGMAAAIMKQNLMWFSHYILGEDIDGFKIF